MNDDARETSRITFRPIVLGVILLLVAGPCALLAAEVPESGAADQQTGSSAGKRVDWDADRFLLKKRGSNTVWVLEGNARLTMPYEDSVITFRGDTISRETATEIITATGNVVIEDGTHTIRSASMVYNAKNRRGHFSGGVPGARGVQLTQKVEDGEENYTETDWLTVTFGDAGIEEIETGPVAGGFLLTGEEPIPIGPVEPATGEAARKSQKGLPRSIAPPPIE